MKQPSVQAQLSVKRGRAAVEFYKRSRRGISARNHERKVERLWRGQCRHDRSIRGLEIWPLHLPPQNAKLMTEQKQLRFRVANSQPYIDDVEKQSKAGVEKGE
jgi:hypothetical protein